MSIDLLYYALLCVKINLLLFSSDAKAVTASLEAFDITVILVCFISCTLCIRSVFKSIKLAKVYAFCTVSKENIRFALSFSENTCCSLFPGSN